jgi:cell division protein ZapE
MLEQGGVYHHPIDAATDCKLDDLFARVADGPGDANVSLEIDGRLIPSRRIANGIIWFDAANLLTAPRGTADYIELAKRYQTVVLSGLQAFTASDPDRRRRFSWMIDEFYDRRVKLIISAAVAVGELLRSAGNSSEVLRTESRLIEMQSHRYLAEAHLL